MGQKKFALMQTMVRRSRQRRPQRGRRKPRYMSSRISNYITRIWERRGIRKRKRGNRTSREDKKRKGLSRMKLTKNNLEHRKKIGSVLRCKSSKDFLMHI